MKNKIRSALGREMRSVRVSDDLKNRILAEAAGERFPERARKFSLAPLAAMAAVMLVVALTVGMLTHRTARPERRSQVFSDGSQDWVWVCEGDALYHARSDCGDMVNPSRMPLQEARDAGRTACRTCIPVSRPTDGPQATVAPTVETSEAPSATAVPVNEMPGATTEVPEEWPATDATEKIVIPEPTESPEVDVDFINGASTLPDAGAVQFDAGDDENFLEFAIRSVQIHEGERIEDDRVWTEGRQYHLEEHCQGMQGATSMERSEAEAQGLTACPVCVTGESADGFWMTQEDAYFHVYAHCSGMTDAEPVTAEEAMKSGRKPCAACMTEPVFATQNGTYYHVASNCSGMQNAYAILLDQALLMGKQRCPVCAGSIPVYATQGGTYYHWSGNCSGMRDAQMISEEEALARGQTGCPICMPMADPLHVQEGSLVLSAVQTAGYLMVEAQPACSVSWIDAPEAVPVDVDSAEFKELTAQLQDCMTASELQEFAELLAAGEIRGVQVVRYDVSASQMNQINGANGETMPIAHAMRSLGFDDPSGTVELFECGDVAAESVSLSVYAQEVDYLVWPDGSSISAASLIDLEPVTLLSSGEDGAVLTFRQSRTDQYVKVDATLNLRQVEGGVLRSRSDDVELTLVTAKDRRFVCLTADEQTDAPAGDDWCVEAASMRFDGRQAEGIPVNSATGYQEYAAYMLEGADAFRNLEMEFVIDGKVYAFAEENME